MRFHTRKRRSPVIIIVSLIDILAILLIFFIVTTTFRKPQPKVVINLPESQSTETYSENATEPLVLMVDASGKILLGSDPVVIENLSSALKSARLENPKRPVALQADRAAEFGVVIKVLDALKEAGIRNVPAFTQPDPRVP